jgi:Zn-dependent peptidase ImmA (M78 family)
LIPEDPAIVRTAIKAKRGEINYRSLLEYVWEHGIPVLPMSGRGGFIASAWQVEGGPAIVLKEPRDVPAFWMFDLAHELGHIASGHVVARSIIDVEEPTSDESLANDDEQEREANDYALNLLVPDHRLRVAEIRERSCGNYLRFKNAVASTAAEYGLNAGVLGVIAAHELTDLGQHKDRWGSSINLSKMDGTGRAVAENAVRHYSDLSALPEDDQALLETVVLGELD